MKDITVQKAAINPTALDAALRGALGAACSGLSFSRGTVTVHLAAEASRQQEAQAEAIVQAHDPDALTADQEADKTRDASPLFSLGPDEIAAWAESQSTADFQRAVAVALVHLRRLLRGA